jgi:hypothetical protein
MMDYPFLGGRNQRYVQCTGTLVLEGLAQGEVAATQRVEYGDTFAALSGAVGMAEAGVELATWTDPRTELVTGFDVAIMAQDSTGFWVRVTRQASGAVATFTWDWEVRGEVA